MRAQLDLAQVRQEIDRRIQEKEEEFENTRWESKHRWEIHVVDSGGKKNNVFQPGRTMREPWTQCKRHWRLKLERRLRR